MRKTQESGAFTCAHINWQFIQAMTWMGQDTKFRAYNDFREISMEIWFSADFNLNTGFGSSNFQFFIFL